MFHFRDFSVEPFLIKKMGQLSILTNELCHKIGSRNCFSNFMWSSKLTSAQINRVSFIKQFLILRFSMVSLLFRLLVSTITYYLIQLYF